MEARDAQKNEDKKSKKNDRKMNVWNQQYLFVKDYNNVHVSITPASYLLASNVLVYQCVNGTLYIIIKTNIRNRRYICVCAPDNRPTLVLYTFS